MFPKCVNDQGTRRKTLNSVINHATLGSSNNCWGARVPNKGRVNEINRLRCNKFRVFFFSLREPNRQVELGGEPSGAFKRKMVKKGLPKFATRERLMGPRISHKTASQISEYFAKGLEQERVKIEKVHLL